jgi:hypothetical protein
MVDARVRVFLDIHHELEGETQRGYQELESITKVFVDTIIEIQCSKKTQRVVNWPPNGDQFFQTFVDEVQNMHSVDQIQDFISVRTNTQPLDSDVTPESYYLLKRHPLSCGLKLYAVRAMYHDLSVKFANAAGTVISCAHLYHALKNERLLTGTWPDMELFLHMQEGDHVFGGPVPRNPKEYLFQYSTMLRKASEAYSLINLQLRHPTPRQS